MKEMKVYVMSIKSIPEGLNCQDITDQDFMNYSEFEGSVYSLRGFENAVNQDDFDSVNSVIRII
jgi:hypothetical protein